MEHLNDIQPCQAAFRAESHQVAMYQLFEEYQPSFWWTVDSSYRLKQEQIQKQHSILPL
jgi:hypothetical protein